MTPILQNDRPGSDFFSYSIFEKYLELITRCGPFYRKPLDGMRFIVKKHFLAWFERHDEEIFSEDGFMVLKQDYF